MTLRLCAKVLLHVWSYDFYDMTLSTEEQQRHFAFIKIQYMYILSYKMGGWMNYDFMSFSIVFQSYRDAGRMIMTGCVQWNPVYG